MTRLRLHRPDASELGVRQAWLRDPAMMAYNVGWDVPHPGYDRTTGCIEWPEDEWPAFLQRYAPEHEPDAGYFYLQDAATGAFFGHVHYRVERPAREAHIGINVVPSDRRQGLGLAGLRLLIGHLWRATDAVVIVNEFEPSRTAAVRLHAAAGFRPVGASEHSGRPIERWELRR